MYGCDENSTSTADWVTGLDWIRINHPILFPNTPAVVNISLETWARETPLETSVLNLVAGNIAVIVAAGNRGIDACGHSPAALGPNPGIVTVSGSTSTDGGAGFDYGTCVDIFAPGAGLLAAASNDPFGEVTTGGTSAASPLVAGVMAKFLGRAWASNPAQLEDALKSRATTNRLDGTIGSGSPNMLLYSGYRSRTVSP